MFKENHIEEEDNSLVDKALSGDKIALENLIKKHQNWIYNVALSMVCHDQDAADLTQEVLIKIITKLTSFKKGSTFKTWVYRIVKNHFLNTKRSRFEAELWDFQKFGDLLDKTSNEYMKPYAHGFSNEVVIEESRISCMRAMLLCLDREQRFIFIIGEIFDFSSELGGKIMETTSANFRVKLHRARKQLYNFMNNKCGLVNKNNPCRCAKKTAGFIKAGAVDPKNLFFQKSAISTVEKTIHSKVKMLENEVVNEYKQLYQNHPYLKGPESLDPVKKLLSSKIIRETFNLE